MEDVDFLKIHAGSRTFRLRIRTYSYVVLYAAAATDRYIATWSVESDSVENEAQLGSVVATRRRFLFHREQRS